MDYEKYKKRIAFSISRFGRASHAEDAAQEFFLGVLEGKHQHQTIDQFVIDYLRKHLGSSRAISHNARKLFENASSIDEQENSIAAPSRPHLHNGRDFWRLTRYCRIARDREIAGLYYYWGYSEAEIADHYKVNPARVYQILQRIQSCISKGIKKESKAKNQRTGTMEKVGEIKRQDLSLGTNEGLAFEKPREMAALNEESFVEWLT